MQAKSSMAASSFDICSSHFLFNTGFLARTSRSATFKAIVTCFCIAAFPRFCSQLFSSSITPEIWAAPKFLPFSLLLWRLSTFDTTLKNADNHHNLSREETSLQEPVNSFVMLLSIELLWDTLPVCGQRDLSASISLLVLWMMDFGAA